MQPVITIETVEQVPNTRRNFKRYLAMDENHFGNLSEKNDLQPDDTYECIGCIGFNPEVDELYASIVVKQAVGYGTDQCGVGSPEYVRFYLSYDNGSNWQDVGAAGIQVYNLPEGTEGRLDLDYAVRVQVEPRYTSCQQPGFVRVRAILSWTQLPPANMPNFTPVWGEVQEATIQRPKKSQFDGIIVDLDDLLPEPITKWSDLIKLPNLSKLPIKPNSQSFDLSGFNPPELDVDALTQPPQLSDLNTTPVINLPELEQVFEQYQEFKHVMEAPQHFLAPYVEALKKTDNDEETLYKISKQSLGSFKDILSELDVDIDDLLNSDGDGEGNTSYEELDCVALDRDRERAVAFFRIKRPAGYSGNLCTDGSRQFVTFWADTDGDGSFENAECLGTTSVAAYDFFDDLPEEGVHYAVSLEVDFSKFRQPRCEEAVIMPLRGVLSWATPHPCDAPNAAPTWGNRQDSLVHIRPGDRPTPNVHLPDVWTIGGMDVEKINSSGYATGQAAFPENFTADNSPFGGIVNITGQVTNPIDVDTASAPLRYRVQVRPAGSSTWQTLNDELTLTLRRAFNGVPVPVAQQTIVPDADGFYPYLKDTTLNLTTEIQGDVLAIWDTGSREGRWEMQVQVKNPTGGTPDVWSTPVYHIRLDNTAPTAELDVTSIVRCGDGVIGDDIVGTYTATDVHFDRATFSLTTSATTNNLSGRIDAPAGATPGNMPAGTQNFRIDTDGMEACGYVLRLWVFDRTIVNSDFVGRRATAIESFCLRNGSAES